MYLDTVKIRVVSEGLHVSENNGTGLDHDFDADGMFVINDEIINVTYGRGLNVLVYNVDNGRYIFQVNNFLQSAQGKLYLVYFSGP